jgi:nitrile hydratase accessory protein
MMQPVDVLSCKSLADLRGLDTFRFPTPWSARAFGVVLALAERGQFTLVDFQTALIAEIAAYEQQGGSIDSDDAYYSRWIEALAAVLKQRQLISGETLEAAESEKRAALAAMDHDHHHAHHPIPLVTEMGL